jgi:hypothetical protein
VIRMMCQNLSDDDRSTRMTRGERNPAGRRAHFPLRTGPDRKGS